MTGKDVSRPLVFRSEFRDAPQTPLPRLASWMRQVAVLLQNGFQDVRQQLRFAHTPFLLSLRYRRCRRLADELFYLERQQYALKVLL